MKTLFVAWQEPESKEWIPVARLEHADGKYRFSYTRGALRVQGFQPFGRMDNLTGVYEAETLFPLFSNRVISRSRPEFKDFLRWLGLPETADDPMSILSLTGGIRGTDDIELFAPPTITENGEYQLTFFSRGIRHLSKEAIQLIGTLKEGARLYVMQDRQNTADEFALALRSGDPVVFVGYCPKYYANDLRLLLDADCELEVRVKAMNSDAPLNMRLLCSVSAKISKKISLMANESDFCPVTDTVPSYWHGLSLDLNSEATL